MSQVSVFELFKIGVGPSSSHTLGPWRAAERFLRELDDAGMFERATAVTVDLFGALAKTGKGHGTHLAVQLGLAGEDPETIASGQIFQCVETIARNGVLNLDGRHEIPFQAETDIRFQPHTSFDFHPNALRLSARFASGAPYDRLYFSIGGGFLVSEGQTEPSEQVPARESFATATELLEQCRRRQCSIADFVLDCERTLHSEQQIQQGLTGLWRAMLQSVYRGCHGEGELPGGLRVMRRAGVASRRLLEKADPRSCKEWLEVIRWQPSNAQAVFDWVSCFAMAVNEENAAFGRVVTAPTNGAAGVIPAVLLYYLCFTHGKDDEVADFLLTASAIGSLFKQGATLSAAQGGCQAEIGVASAMAAAALAECLGGSPAQAVEAAEIAMEHHLGLTCDPVAGLVQIPCIERNSMGAVKAITAATLALHRDPAEAKVSLDEVIKTMWETARDMNAKYKETAEGGLAVNVPVNLSEC